MQSFDIPKEDREKIRAEITELYTHSTEEIKTAREKFRKETADFISGTTWSNKDHLHFIK